MAAASWSASAARSAWVRRSRLACVLTSSMAGTSIHSRLNASRRAIAARMFGSASDCSRSSRASADRHSTRLPHQVTIAGSMSINASMSALRNSPTTNGRMAELSQYRTRQRESARSASSIATADALPSSWPEGRSRQAVVGSAIGSSNRPFCASSIAAEGTPVARPIGINCATGTPRSVMTKVAPPRISRTRALSPFFASEREIVLM